MPSARGPSKKFIFFGLLLAVTAGWSFLRPPGPEAERTMTPAEKEVAKVPKLEPVAALEEFTGTGLGSPLAHQPVPPKTSIPRKPASFQETPYVQEALPEQGSERIVHQALPKSEPTPPALTHLVKSTETNEINSKASSQALAPGSKLALDLGLGLTYLNYREKINQTQFKLSEAGLTLKAGAGYVLSSKFELGGNGFITAVPVKLSGEPDALRAARFYGVNGRVGYLVDEINPRAKIYVFLGYYLWGTVIPAPRSPNLSYGVSLLSGPQVFLTGRFQTAEGRKFSTYVKAATMANGSNLSFSNRELALGGSYEVGPVSGPRKQNWFLGLDYANAQYAAPHQSFELNSLSLGITMGF